MKLIRDMTEPELLAYFRELAGAIEGVLPPGPSAHGKCLFCLLVADTSEPGVAQYVSNVHRADMIKMLRETATRLEGREDRGKPRPPRARPRLSDFIHNPRPFCYDGRAWAATCDRRASPTSGPASRR
jgi:hypothetical protein